MRVIDWIERGKAMEKAKRAMHADKKMTNNKTIWSLGKVNSLLPTEEELSDFRKLLQSQAHNPQGIIIIPSNDLSVIHLPHWIIKIRVNWNKFWCKLFHKKNWVEGKTWCWCKLCARQWGGK